MLVGRGVALAVAAPVVAATASVAAVFLSGAHRRLGASVEEVWMSLPGDELLPTAQVQNDRACTLPAAPADVWPWIAQLGQDKAGFYSWEALENLAGCQIVGATRVHPEWQNIAVGDPFRLHPDVALRVARVEPGRALVVTSQGGDALGDMAIETTWAFCLSPIDGSTGSPATRLHLRERYCTPSRASRALTEATSVISALMSWRMMSNLAALVSVS